MKKGLSVLLCALSLLIQVVKAQVADPVPEHIQLTIQSVQLLETRIINVWTPPGYGDATDSLPVLYMLDGGLEEDFPHIALTVSQLIGAQKIPPMILVGIENTQRRRDLTGPTEIAADKTIAPEVGGAELFRLFLQQELFVLIDNTFRTTNQRGIIGESLAGLFVMETFFLSPDMFDAYIAMDPSFWWNDHYLIRTAEEHLSKLSPGDKRCWFAGSGARDIHKYTKELAKILNKENIPGLQWHYQKAPKEKHHTIFRATKEQALVWTFGRAESE